VSAETLPTDRLIGEVLAHRYEILHRLGEGAMGAVYKARHVKVGRFFAVKVLHRRVLEDAKVVKRFEREAELAGRLRHANVVGVVDVGEIDGMRYMVMDFAEGPDLAQLLEEAPMPPARIIHLVRQLLEGLYHAHEQGLIHRDFKPENVIVERDAYGAELPRIVDFGIAILRDGGTGVDGEGRLTTNGLVLGTPHYMAPEQAVADPIDHRIDLFALGIVVYEMLSGRLPYDGSGAEVARANLLLDPPPIMQRVPYLEVDPLLEAFARRLLAKKRNARPATAKAARELLDLIERDRPAAAAALGLPQSLSQRTPAVTEPVAAQSSGATSGAAPEGRPWDAGAAGALWPTMPAASPTAVSAPRGPIDPRGMIDSRAPVDQHHIETSQRIALSWETVPSTRRRTPWLVIGIAAGVVGIAIAVMLARAPSDEPAATRVVMTPLTAPPPTTPPPPPTTNPAEVPTAATQPSAPTPVVDTAPAPDVAVAVPAPVDAKPRKTPRATKATEARASERKVAPPTSRELKAVDARPEVKTEARADAKTGSEAEPRNEPRPVARGDGKGDGKTDAKTVARPPRVTGLTANELSHFYASVGRELSALPSAQAQDLWSRLLLIKIQELMAAPQDRRDDAAKQLLQIHQEAVARKP